MANNPFDRTVINPRERPASSDINRLISEGDRVVRELFAVQAAGRISVPIDDQDNPISGFFGEAFAVRPNSPLGLSVLVKHGIGMVYNPATSTNIGGVANVNDLATWKPVVLIADQTIAIPTPPLAPNSRYDLLEVRTNQLIGEPSSRDILDLVTGVFDPTLVNKSLLWSVDASIGSVNDPAPSTAALSLKVGVPGNPPTPPSVTSGYVGLARIFVNNGVSTLDNDVIRRDRRLIRPHAQNRLAILGSSPSPYSGLTLSSLVAPPGFRVVLVWDSFGSSTLTFDLYVFPEGQAVSPETPVLFTGPGITNAGGGVVLSSIVVDSTIQGIVNGANANPATKVAVGQGGWRMQNLTLSPVSANPAFFSLGVDIFS